MTMTAVAPADTGWRTALDHEAPYLIEKLLKERIVDSAAEGEALFTEVKRYLVLARTDPDLGWNMHSTVVDAVWHQFVLFTREYGAYCRAHFGEYVHHNPSNAPETPGEDGRPEGTFRQFRERYEARFGIALPDLWFDERNVGLDRRVIHDGAGAVRVVQRDGLVTLVDPHGEVLIELDDDLARPAIEFIAATGSFHVRELPGELTDDERVALTSVLVEHRLVRLAP